MTGENEFFHELYKAKFLGQSPDQVEQSVTGISKKKGILTEKNYFFSAIFYYYFLNLSWSEDYGIRDT